MAAQVAAAPAPAAAPRLLLSSEDEAAADGGPLGLLDLTTRELSLAGLEKEIEACGDSEVLRAILDQGACCGVCEWHVGWLRLVVVLPRLLFLACYVACFINAAARHCGRPQSGLAVAFPGSFVGAGCLLAWIPTSASWWLASSHRWMDIRGGVAFAGVDPREYSRQYEAKLRQAEVASIQVRLIYTELGTAAWFTGWCRKGATQLPAEAMQCTIAVEVDRELHGVGLSVALATPTVCPSRRHCRCSVPLALHFLYALQDYIAESDSLAELHSQIKECDGILVQMEGMLGRFQVGAWSTFLGAAPARVPRAATQRKRRVCGCGLHAAWGHSQPVAAECCAAVRLLVPPGGGRGRGLCYACIAWQSPHFVAES